MDSLILKSDLENVQMHFSHACVFWPFLLDKEMNRCGLGSSVAEVVTVRQNFRVQG